MPDPNSAAYKQWLLDTARRLRAEDRPPHQPEDVEHRARETRRHIRAATGDAILEGRDVPPPDPQLLGIVRRDGYHIERLLFQTRPGCYATANVYVPEGKGPFPAVLNVHGHWAGARMDPVVQSRCLGLVKLGFLALVLDAWGAGERGTRPGVAEYHGGLLGASLWPVDTPLYGLQLNDNLRAMDYLQSRPDVDSHRIGCTGASGGGNQTTHFSAYDPRIRCAVPVCSVGTFQSYLDAACCVDEVLPGALTFAEEGDLLGMLAPRPLMVITATRDTYHFGPEAARAALDRARPYFAAHGAEERVRHVLIESGHDYGKPMREAMYGWMRRWLMNEGDGSPVPEPQITIEDPAAIRCFGEGFRSPKVMTTVRWTAERGRELASRAEARLRGGEDVLRDGRRELERRLALPVHPEPRTFSRDRGYETEPGVWLRSDAYVPVDEEHPTEYLFFHPDGPAAAVQTGLFKRKQGTAARLDVMDLRGVGALALPDQDLRGQIPDHNLAEWGLWIGRPLLGQWVHDIRQMSRPGKGGKTVAPQIVVAWGEAGIAAVLAAALEPAITGVAVIGAPATLVSDTPPHSGMRMALFHPGLLKLGDIPHLAALTAPRNVLLANPLALDGSPVHQEELDHLTATARGFHARHGKPGRYLARAEMSDAEISKVLREWEEQAHRG